MSVAERVLSGAIVAIAFAWLICTWVIVRAMRRVFPHRSASGDFSVQSLRACLLEKLERSRAAWDRSVARFRALHWICLIGVIVVPTCLASLGKYMSDLTRDILSVTVAIFGSVQAIVRPATKFLRDIEFRDEADYLIRLATTTDNQAQLRQLIRRFELVERRFHQGQHPWAVAAPQRGQGEWNEAAAASTLSKDVH